MAKHNEPDGYMGMVRVDGEYRFVDSDWSLPRHNQSALNKAEKYRAAGHKAKLVKIRARSGPEVENAWGIAFRHNATRIKGDPELKEYYRNGEGWGMGLMKIGWVKKMRRGSW